MIPWMEGKRGIQEVETMGIRRARSAEDGGFGTSIR